MTCFASLGRSPRSVALLAVAALALSACSENALTDSPATASAAADGVTASASAATERGAPIDGEYIVVLKPSSSDVPGLARRFARDTGGEVLATYEHALKGFALRGVPAQAVDGLRNNPHIAYIEPNRSGGLFATQTNATWGIDRVDQQDLPLSTTYTYNNNGSGAHVYIFDTGVNLSHNEFGGRAQYVPNGSNGDFVGDNRGNASDCHGHGTHVASTAAGAVYGVAKSAPIWAARVVNCQGGGNVSMVISAIDWVTANGQRPAVVNMSLGYGDVQSLRDAVETSVASGINYAVAAGNGDWLGRPLNACNEAPAGAPNVITVGATTSSDSESSFSNYGTCVDILAPGSSITAASYSSNNGTTTMSGTSMATPHVAGAVALYLTANPSATPGQVETALETNAIANTISLHSRSQQGGTPNRMLYTAFIGGGGTPGNNAPTANFSFSCDDLACSFSDSSSDSDGSVVSRSWSFGDGGSSSSTNPSHTYGSSGAYSVTLTVTDDDGASDSVTKTVTVSSTPPPSGITLSVSTGKQRGESYADLSWSPADGGQVSLRRNGTSIGTTADDGSARDVLGKRVRGTFTYQVCETDSGTCSNIVSVSF